MNAVNEAIEAMGHAKRVLEYIKEHYPDIYQEALDNADE